jgi:pyruvate-formate lyase-activating enzyme
MLNPGTAATSAVLCGALLFDIKGFFDNVHKDRLAAIMNRKFSLLSMHYHPHRMTLYVL